MVGRLGERVLQRSVRITRVIDDQNQVELASDLLVPS